MQKKLKKIVTTILDKESEHFELLNAVRSLSDFFGSYSLISTGMAHSDNIQETQHSYLSSGLAISPLDAAICTNEYMRTTKYIRGVYEAIKDLQEKFHDEQIHLVYAGSGPYGTLIVPLLTLFDSKRLQVTLLDIHQSSLDSVKNIINCFGLEEYISAYIQEDATEYKITQKTHIIITETMKAAFDNEPQVAITLNLQPQLCKEGLFIPSKVIINFELIHTEYQAHNGMLSIKNESKKMCEVMVLDSAKELKKENLISNKNYIITEKIKEGMEPFLTTSICVYKENTLGHNECSLTIPKKMSYEKIFLEGDEVSFDYLFGKRSSIDWKFLIYGGDNYEKKI